MKNNFFMEKSKIVTGLIVAGSLFIGVGGMIYGTNRDQKMQEQSEKIVQLPKQDIMDVQYASAQSDAETASEKGSIADSLSQCKVTLQGKGPTSTAALSMEKAASIGLGFVQQSTSKDLAGSDVKMSYTSLVGTSEAGSWKGIVTLGDLCRYEFKVDAGSGDLLEALRVYTRESVKDPWKGKNALGKVEQMISEEHLSSYHKVKVELVSGMRCRVLSGEDYALSSHQEGEAYKLTYEVKDDTLYVKEEVISAKVSRNNRDAENSLMIAIPKGTTLEEVNIDQSVGDINIEGIKCKTMDLKNDTGTVDVNQTEITEKLSALVQTGSIFIQDATLKSAKVEVQTGNVQVEKVSSDDLNVKVNIGEIAFGEGMKGKVKAENNIGEIYTADQKDTACQYDLKTKIGSVDRGGYSQYESYDPENDYNDQDYTSYDNFDSYDDLDSLDNMIDNLTM